MPNPNILFKTKEALFFVNSGEATKFNLEGAFNLVSPNFTTHQEFFKAIINHKKGLLKWVLFLPKVIVKFLLGDMSEMLLYGPKTEPQRALESGYKFKFQSLKDALSNLS